jgi:precorrin-2 dehydrogenase/sirohydrochlorin ferrochelatase
MAFGYPVMLELADRKCVVIGEQAVREGKVEGLLDAGARQITVIAEGPAKLLDGSGDEHAPLVTVERRAWEPRDLDGASLVIASDPSGAAREAIAREARRRGALVNVIDDVPNCDWAAPAVVRRGDLVFAIATGGRSPALARRLREQISERYGSEWEELVEVLGEVRALTFRAFAWQRERADAWARALDLDEAADLVAHGRADELKDRLIERLLSEQPQGTAR